MTTTFENPSTNKPRRGITKAQAYKSGLMCHEYDLEEMIVAFGLKNILATAIELSKRIKRGQRLDRKKKERVSPIAA